MAKKWDEVEGDPIDVTGDGGVLKKIIVAAPEDAEGPPVKGKELTVHYTGSFSEEPDKVFDSSRERDPFDFQLGAGQVIKGWEIAFLGMKVGERAILRIKSDYGYGDQGHGNGAIPGGKTLDFDVELLSFKDKEVFDHVKFYIQKLAEARQKHGKDAVHEDVATALFEVGFMFMRENNFGQSRRFFEQSLAVRRKLDDGQDTPKAATTLLHLGTVANAQNELVFARDCFQQAVDMRRRIYKLEDDTPHNQIAPLLVRVANMEMRMGNFREARVLHEQSLRMVQALSGGPGAVNLDIAHCMVNVGKAMMEEGNFTRARAYFLRSFEMKWAAFGNRPHPDIPTTINMLGTACFRQGDLESSLTYLHQARSMQIEVAGPDNEFAATIGRSIHSVSEMMKDPVYQAKMKRFANHRKGVKNGALMLPPPQTTEMVQKAALAEKTMLELLQAEDSAKAAAAKKKNKKKKKKKKKKKNNDAAANGDATEAEAEAEAGAGTTASAPASKGKPAPATKANGQAPRATKK